MKPPVGSDLRSGLRCVAQNAEISYEGRPGSFFDNALRVVGRRSLTSDNRHKVHGHAPPQSVFTKASMSRYSLDVLRRRYVVEKRPLEASVEQILRADTRAGTRAILAAIDKRRFENRSEGQRLRKMLRFETLLWESGCHAVAGVDEAGMSPLAGPVSAGAVILKPGTRFVGIDDSKRLDAADPEELAKEIKEKAESWCVAFVDVEEIDEINIYWAGIQAMHRAV